ncbi:uncharacterized protein LOC130675769 [Microplitis mediator]|uniref:uncharacterized protein LOC130675769 n=1 Tax=Microplitis mediator TaxID=375433 RepID=UPI00255434DE|nr:uncharacterized protein LOC130675769 [Microplitis mediator]
MPQQKAIPEQRIRSKNEEILIEMEVNKLLNKKAIEKCDAVEGQFISTYFLVKKPDGSHRFILNLKNLNKFIAAPHFKMEDIRTVKNLLMLNDFMASIDLKDAYLLVPVAESSRKYLRFIFQGQIYQFTCLPFGLSISPYIFTKLMKPIVNFLREKGFLLAIYLDDIIFIAKSYNICREKVLWARNFLQKLGFVINDEKSSLVPAQKCKFLGFIVNSVDCTIELTDAKKEHIKNLVAEFKIGTICKIREFATLLGTLNAACPAVAYGLSHCKKLERQKFLDLIVNDGDYDGKMVIKSYLERDLIWWKINSQIGKNPIRTAEYSIEISSDASLTGWGAFCNGKSAHGWWNADQRRYNINFLELLAAFHALKSFASKLNNCEILLRIDNTTAIAYINRAGSVQYPKLSNLAQEIWDWCEHRKIWIFASYISSKENFHADAASRITNIDTEWELANEVFDSVVKKFGPFTIDLFATYENRKVKKFCSRFPNPESFKVDAFTISWKNERVYAFPPFALITAVIKKFITDKAEGVIVAPDWPTQPWYPLLNSLLREPPIVFKPNKHLLLSPCRTKTHPLASRLSLVVAYLSGKNI